MALALLNSAEALPAAASQQDGSVHAPSHTVPSRIVAKSFRGGPVGLGLEQPLDLLGGDRIGPEGMVMALPFESSALTNFVATACREQSIAGRNWFGLPPAVLVSKPGHGRTHVARQIARLAGVPFATLDVGGPTGERRLRSDGRCPDLVLPPLPVLAMASARCANPIILITGIQDVTSTGAANLARMLDPRSNESVVLESVGVRFDFSAVTWLISADQYGILDRSIVQNAVEIPLDDQVARPAFQTHVLSILREAMADLDIDDGERSMLGSDLLNSTNWIQNQRTASGLYDAATAYLLRWISSAR